MKAGNVNVDALNNRISGESSWTNQFFDMAKVAESHTFGDRAQNAKYAPPKFEFGDPMKPIESNADEIAEDAKDDLDDV